MNTEYNLQLEKLCNCLNLGELISPPIALSGGYLHRMYALETRNANARIDRYAIKALNPQIMLRPTAMQNYINSEAIANMVVPHIPALPAKQFNGTSLQNLDGQFYLVFDWIEGKSLKSNEITNFHCEKIGGILAVIHRTDFAKLNIPKPLSDAGELVNWQIYLDKGRQHHAEWTNLLEDCINQLYDWNNKANESAKLLSSNLVISHRDLDPKNVLWHKDNPLIIDWEAAGYINPMADLLETALYWCENEAGEIEKERLFSFFDGYKHEYTLVEVDWKQVLFNGFLSKMGWLEYNLKRSLGIECADEKEQQLGAGEVIGTIEAIKGYGAMIRQLEEWFKET